MRERTDEIVSAVLAVLAVCVMIYLVFLFVESFGDPPPPDLASHISSDSVNQSQVITEAPDFRLPTEAGTTSSREATPEELEQLERDQTRGFGTSTELLFQEITVEAGTTSIREATPAEVEQFERGYVDVHVGGEALIWVPMQGPAKAEGGNPCDGFFYALQSTYEWRQLDPNTPDGDYVGVIRIQDGQMVPCPHASP